MKKIFLIFAVFVMAICANAQTNQYFWYQGNLMMGNPIAQIDSVTFGEGETVDTLHIMLPRTIIKTVFDTVYVTIHDTVCPNENMYNGHEYVDLGLPSGLLWATCNVGANVPEQIGGYYSWGETQTKTNYTLDDYLYKNSPITLSDISGTQYDAATANWGAEWRMPTKQECNELISYCTIKDTTINNVVGKLVIGTNNNRIFVSASGFYAEKLYYCQSEGSESFWTSTACGSPYAYRMWEWSYISFSEREQGFQIRPVVSGSVVNQ